MTVFKSLCILLFISLSSVAIQAKETIGQYEYVTVLPQDLDFKAKVDTGAKNSSMHATNIEIYTEGSKRFVRFETKDSSGKSATINLPVHRTVKIKRHGASSQRRAIVIMGICVGNTYKQAQVSLTDRKKFKYPFLIGASFLKDSFLVDVSQEFMNTSNCNIAS